MEESLEEKKARLRRYQEAYYNLDPIVSDAEYDALLQEVKELDPQAGELKLVGAPIPQHSVWEKVEHAIPMGSLDKANSTEEFRTWADKIDAPFWFITHKIDGSSMELVYDEGVLIRCVTRGDGVVGENVTTNIVQVPSVPKKLKESLTVTIRGEIVMMKDVFKEKYSEEYANPRNTAAGKVRQKKDGGEACQDLEFLAYWTSKHPKQPRSVTGVFNWLHSLGFKTPPSMTSNDLKDVKLHFDSTAKMREAVPYEIDGMVVSVDSLDIMEQLGDLNMRPRGQIAWKFEALMGITRVENVRWQVGPSGRVTPVADVEPVEVGGVTISSISLHNLSLFRDLKLWKGCRVLISRRNDVIPYIEKNLDLENA